MQLPSEHIVWPLGHIVEQLLFEQTWPLGQGLQPPQCWALDPTHWLSQRIRPDGHAQALFWQVCPPVQALPQEPQFALSLAVLTHTEPHAVWPVPQVTPVEVLGFAQPATTKRHPSDAVRRAERNRVFIDLPRR
jgi:hypothetical protein